MNKYIVFTIGLLLISYNLQGQTTGESILRAVDKNMSAQSRVIESKMVIKTRNNVKEMTSLSYTMGVSKSFTEYLSPAREKGTKMLKLDKEMWLYSPSADRTIMISGHMLRQSVMGSDLSYEDMMDDRKLHEIYDAELVGNEKIEERDCFLIHLTAKTDDISYQSQKLWVDSERMIPLKEELYGKSGQLLKRITLSDVRRVQGRWFPYHMNYKDMLKSGEGTDWIIVKIEFDVKIDEMVFNKASLRK